MVLGWHGLQCLNILSEKTHLDGFCAWESVCLSCQTHILFVLLAVVVKGHKNQLTLPFSWQTFKDYHSLDCIKETCSFDISSFLSHSYL